MIKQLDVVFGEEVANTLGGVNRGVIPVQKPVPCCYFRSFCFESLQKSPQGLQDEGSIDSLSPRHVVAVHHPLGVKEGNHHLFSAGGMDLGFYRARGSLF